MSGRPDRRTVHLPNEPWPFSYVCLGWAGIVTRLVADLDDVVPGWRVTQVKEKFGGLRFGITLSDVTPERAERAYDLVRAAEEESLRVCDMCGAAGSMYTSPGWARTRCEEHRDLVPREIADPDSVSAEIRFPDGEEYRWP